MKLADILLLFRDVDDPALQTPGPLIFFRAAGRRAIIDAVAEVARRGGSLMKRVVSVLAVVLSSCVLLAQQPLDVNRRFSPEQLTADVDFYLKTLEDEHIEP